MVSRSSSPSQLLNHPNASYSLPYNMPIQDSQHPDTAMGRSHNTLDIVLPSSDIFLRGTGVDVEPSTLQGTLVLTLVEATHFKEITMQLRAKSRVPNMQSESSSILYGSYLTNVIFTHDWSFLEGDRKHTHTLKAGRHAFPFQFQLDAAHPSTLAIFDGISGISYKLRATAVRPVFATNLHAAASVRVIRALAPGALEYQQTLEVEGTWPEKIMYSLMIPHKAWAAGDTVSTLVKFSPLLKGVRITSITSAIQEYMTTFSKAGSPHEEMRVVTTTKYEIRNGQAVPLQLTDPSMGAAVPWWPTPPWSTPNSPPPAAPSDGVSMSTVEGIFSLDPFSAGAQQIFNGVPIMGPQEISAGSLPSSSYTEPSSSADEGMNIGEEEIVTTLSLTLPISCTPSHTLEPVKVTHRIRWSIFILNPDGHKSELRCLLPLHILDHVLLDEARIATSATRRLLFGLEYTQPSHLEEMGLPSYPAHVLDRVANAHLPATIHLSNLPVNRQSVGSRSPRSRGPSISTGSPPTQFTPRDTPPITPGETHSAPALDWVNSELHQISRAWQRPGSNALTPPDSTQTSRHTSRVSSRAGSRAGSPERGSVGGSSTRPERENGAARNHNHHSIFSLKPLAKAVSSLHPKDGQAPSRHPAIDGHASGSAHPSPTNHQPGLPSPLLPRSTAEGEVDGMELLNRAFSTVPHYDVASRGFLGGGVTPLSSTQGLPSYEETERSQSDGDLADRFAAARTRNVPRDDALDVEPAGR